MHESLCDAIDSENTDHHSEARCREGRNFAFNKATRSDTQRGCLLVGTNREQLWPHQLRPSGCHKVFLALVENIVVRLNPAHKMSVKLMPEPLQLNKRAYHNQTEQNRDLQQQWKNPAHVFLKHSGVCMRKWDLRVIHILSDTWAYVPRLLCVKLYDTRLCRRLLSRKCNKGSFLSNTESEQGRINLYQTCFVMTPPHLSLTSNGCKIILTNSDPKDETNAYTPWESALPVKQYYGEDIHLSLSFKDYFHVTSI